MSVAWTQNGSGQYLVESKEHLLQIMNQGALGADTGTPPADYWSASYLQTSDIDLVNDHASIVPIGDPRTSFDGVYDGGLFEIKNWSFTSSDTYTGLFSYVGNQSVLKRIRLSGVWTLSLSGSYSRAGFLVGRCFSGQMFDIEGDFSTGTTVSGVTNLLNFGSFAGEVWASTVQSLKLYGSVEFEAVFEGTNGGLFGHAAESSTFTDCHNFASFPTGISGNTVGGIFGSATNTTSTNCLNGMTGDLTCSLSCGGIVGEIVENSQWENIVNSMTGTVSCNPSYSGKAGGVFGYVGCSDGNLHTAARILNYMHGDITSAKTPGGLIGEIYGSDPATLEVSKSVVAIRGSVSQSVRGTETFVPGQLEVAVDTSFGMTNNTNNYGLATMVVDAALVYHANFSDLPYIDLASTDPDGNVHKTAFLFANMGGKYPEYTHLSVHTAAVSAPYYTDFGLGDGNTVVYLTYANIDTNSIHHDPLLTVVSTVATTIIQITGDAAGDSSLGATVTKTDFLFDGGNVYDITEAGTQVSAAANDLFATGDAVAVNVNGNSTTTTFVNRGGELDITGSSALLLPFDPNVADVQDATLTLSDATFVSVGFDQPSGQITVDGITYSAGDYFIMDGKKVTVVDI